MDLNQSSDAPPPSFFQSTKGKLFIVLGATFVLAVALCIIIPIAMRESQPTAPVRRPDQDSSRNRSARASNNGGNAADTTGSTREPSNTGGGGGLADIPGGTGQNRPSNTGGDASGSRVKELPKEATEILKKDPKKITKKDIDYIAKLNKGIPSSKETEVEKKRLDDFLAANRPEDLEIKKKFVDILKKAEKATIDEVKFIKDNVERALQLELASQKEIDVFLDLHKPKPPVVDVAKISSILRKQSFFDVLEDEVALVQKVKDEEILKDRAKQIGEFLQLHSQSNRELAYKLKGILDKSKGKMPSELDPKDLELLKRHAINQFGLPIMAFLASRKRTPRTLAAGQKPPTLSELLEELGQVFRDFCLGDAKNLAEKARDLFDEAVEAIKAEHLEKSFPLLLSYASFDEYALDLLLAEFDSIMTPSIDLVAGGQTVDVLKNLLAAIQEVLISCHPRFEEFDKKTLEDIKKECKPIASLEDYKTRAIPVIQGLITLLEKPPLKEKIVGFRMSLVVRFRSELEIAVPGQADPSPLNLAPAVREGDVIKALAKNVKASVTCYFADTFHDLLDAPSLDVTSCTLLLQWFHLIAIEWTHESCGNVLFDKLDPTRIATVMTYAIKRARDEFINRVKLLETADELDEMLQFWKSAVKRFGFLSSAENHFQINNINDMKSCKQVIARIVRTELYDSIYSKADDAVIEAKFMVFQRVYKILNRTSKLMSKCTNAQEAKDAYNQSNKNPEVYAGNLRKEILEDIYADRTTVDKSSLDEYRKVVSKLRQVLNSNPQIWTPEERALWSELRSSKDIARYIFCERVRDNVPLSPIKGKGYREYRMKVALYDQKFKEYERCNTDQAAIDKLFNELKALKKEIEELQLKIQDFPEYHHPLQGNLTFPKVAQTANIDPFSNCEADTAGSMYTFWNGNEDDYAASMDLLKNPFAFTYDPSDPTKKDPLDDWLTEENILYVMPAEDKNVIAFLFNSIPFDGSFSPYPAYGKDESSLIPDSTIMIPPAAFSYMIDVDVHLQSLENDPVHLMFWTIRAQQAMFATNGIGKNLVKELISAYKIVKKRVADIPAKNPFQFVLHDLLGTPITHDILQDMRSSNPSKPDIHALFDCGKCIGNDASQIPGPSPGMLVYLYRNVMECVDQRYTTWSTNLDFEGVEVDKEGWKQFWRLEILGAFDSQAMLPTMRQWIHDNRSWFCKNDKVRKMVIGYACQNRSTFLYDEVDLVCGGTSKSRSANFVDYPRPVSGIAVGDRFRIFHQTSGVEELRLTQVDLSDVTAFDVASDDAKAEQPNIKFERARKAMQKMMDALQNQWEVFARNFPKVKFVNSNNIDTVGIDAGGLSRDAINYAWMYLLNAKFSGLFIDVEKLMPNLNSDPIIGRVLASLILWGLQRELMPFRYFDEKIQKLIFRDKPAPEDEIYNNYIKTFKRQDSNILIDGQPALINAVDGGKTLDGFEEYYFRSPLYWRPLSLNPQGQLFMCGQHVNEHLAENYNWTEAAPEYYKRRYLQLFRLEAITRFQMFSMNLLEIFSRAVPNDNLKELRPSSFADDKVFTKLNVDDYKSEDVIAGMQIDSSCFYPSTWSSVVTPDPITNLPVPCDPNRILLKDNVTRESLRDVFARWLTKTWAPTLPKPTETSTNEEKQKYRQSRRNLERFLTIVTGSASKPMLGKGKYTIKLNCYPLETGGDYRMQAPHPHSCFNYLDLFPIPDENFFEKMMEEFVNDPNATRYGTK